MPEKVSVVMPVFNGERYLDEAAASVLAQTYGELELIIVDDGSTDRSAAIAGRLAAAHPGRVSCVRQKNSGPGAARNAGMRAASGDCIAFIDADDRWRSDKLELQMAALGRSPGAGLVYSDLCFIDENGRQVESGGARKYELPRGGVTLALLVRYFMVTSTVVVRRAVARRAGWFREDIFVGEDYDYLLRLSALCDVEKVEEELLFKRRRAGSLSSVDRVRNDANDLLVYGDFIRSHPSFYREHRKTVNAILGGRSFSLGYRLLRSGSKRAALPYFAVSLRRAPSFKALKCLLQVALPFRLLRFVRSAVRREAPRGGVMKERSEG